jgi:hypothetical protein
MKGKGRQIVMIYNNKQCNAASLDILLSKDNFPESVDLARINENN